MTILQTEEDGTLTPEAKAELLSKLLAIVSIQMEPIALGDLLRHLMKAFKADEEVIAGAIHEAFFLLISTGIVSSNDYDPVARSAIIGADTTVFPSRRLTAFIWDQPHGEDFP